MFKFRKGQMVISHDRIGHIAHLPGESVPMGSWNLILCPDLKKYAIQCGDMTFYEMESCIRPYPQPKPTPQEIPMPAQETPMEDTRAFINRMTGETIIALGAGTPLRGKIEDIVLETMDREAKKVKDRQPTLRDIEIAVKTGPKPDTTWKHYNGNTYRVLFLTNVGHLSISHIPHVVHVSLGSGEIYSRSILDWARSMSPVEA